MIESIYNIKPSDIKAQVALSNADGRGNNDEYFGPKVTKDQIAVANTTMMEDSNSYRNVKKY